MGKRRFTHAFDGYAKLCSWTFRGNNDVSFTSRFLRTNFYRASKAKDDVAPYLLFQATEPPFTMWQRMQALLNGIDNTNTNVLKFNRRRPDRRGSEANYVAVSDFWQSYAFNLTTLRTRGRVEAKVPGGTPFGSTLPLPSSSHPIPEYGTSNLITYVCIMNPLPFGANYVRVIRVVSAKVRRLIANIRVDQVPYMHSFGLSKNYAVIFAAPLFVNIARMMETAEPVNSLDWFPDRPMNVYVVNIHTGRVKRFKTEPVFPMHNINAYEDDNGVILADAVTYPDIQFMKGLEMRVLANKTARDLIPANAVVKRFVIDVQRNSIGQRTFDATPGHDFVNRMDMPVINENFRHKKYCFTYGLSLRSDNVHLSNTTLVKKNVCEAGKDQAWYQLNHFPTEPWFQPRPDAVSEDDGILLSLVLDGEKKKSYLGIWDAKSMKLVNKSFLPKRYPFTLHGHFFADV